MEILLNCFISGLNSISFSIAIIFNSPSRTSLYRVDSHFLPIIDFVPFFAMRVLAFFTYFSFTCSSQITYHKNLSGFLSKSVNLSSSIIGRTCSFSFSYICFISSSSKMVTGETVSIMALNLLPLINPPCSKVWNCPCLNLLSTPCNPLRHLRHFLLDRLFVLLCQFLWCGQRSG